MELEALQKTTALQEVKPPAETSQENKYWTLSQRHETIKRGLDLLITFLVMPIILPLGLLTAILIKLDSKGPVFFIQERVGRYGETFQMFKFRSMTIHAEKDGNKFAKKNDLRVTKIGSFLRRYRIDEIPNFWNVIKGEMSVIGPRPEQVNFVELFNEEIDRYNFRHSVKPGITGLAQVNQGYAACMRSTQMKLNYDLFYIRHYSVKVDAMIILKTVRTILTGFGSR